MIQWALYMDTQNSVCSICTPNLCDNPNEGFTRSTWTKSEVTVFGEKFPALPDSLLLPSSPA